jgi:hypothetical protein
LPELVFRHIDDVPAQEVRAQLHGEDRVGVRCRFLEFSDTRILIFTEYDPNLVLEVHGHRSDHMLYILKGEVWVGEQHCTPGMMVLLEEGAQFGPIVAGPEGTELLEFYLGDGRPVSMDPAGYQRLLAERGIVEIIPHPAFDPTLQEHPADAPGGAR